MGGVRVLLKSRMSRLYRLIEAPACFWAARRAGSALWDFERTLSAVETSLDDVGDGVVCLQVQEPLFGAVSGTLGQLVQLLGVVVQSGLVAPVLVFGVLLLVAA